MIAWLFVLAVQCPDGTPPPCAGVRAPAPVLAVRAFESRSRDTADSYLAATLTEDVTAALAATHAVRVVNPRASARGAEYVLAGSVRRAGGGVQVVARVERAGSGEIIWTTSLAGAEATASSAADTLAVRILARLGVRRLTPVHAARAVNPVIYDVYLRGRYYVSRRTAPDMARGLGLLQQVVAADSSFALAWAAITRTFSYAYNAQIPLPGIGRDSLVAHALEASEHALVSDSASAETWAARALALAGLERTSRVASLRAFRRALTIDSLNAEIWASMGLALEESGDTAGALRAVRRSLAIEPGHAIALTNGALHFYWARELDSAAAWTDSLMAVDPAFIASRRLKGTVALAEGRLSVAEAEFSAARTIAPGVERVWSLAGLTCVAAARGDSAAARRLVRELEPLTDSAAPGLHHAIFVAWAYTALGEKGRALDWLERYRPAGDLHFQRHLHDWPLDPLRGEPRFQALLASH